MDKTNKLQAGLQLILLFLLKLMAKFKKTPQLHFILLGVVLMLIGRAIAFGPVPPNLNFFAEILIYTVVALGLNLLLGFSALVSLSTAAFIGVTVHSMNIFMNTYDINFFIAAFLSLIIAGVFGLIIGMLSLKMEGIYLAIATLFVGHIITEIFRASTLFYNGETRRIGAINFFGDYTLNNIMQADRLALFNIVVIGLVIAYIVTYNIVKSPTGRALMAISRSQHAALAMGISVRKYRLLAFVIATMLASFGGILHVVYFQATGTADKWGLNLSLIVLAIVVIGGMKSLYGSLLGAFLIVGIPAFFLREIEILQGLDDILTGVLVVVVILFYPYGAAHVFYDFKKLYYKLKRVVREQVVKRRG